MWPKRGIAFLQLGEEPDSGCGVGPEGAVLGRTPVVAGAEADCGLPPFPEAGALHRQRDAGPNHLNGSRRPPRFAPLASGRGEPGTGHSIRSRHWHTPKVDGKVDKNRPTEFGRAMAELGIKMIPGYTPQARGRSERLFGTVQGRLPQELARAGVTEMEEANAFFATFWPRFNASFAVRPKEERSAFVPLTLQTRKRIPDILCLKTTRTVGNDNCISYLNRRLQIPPQPHRAHYMRAKVTVHEYEDGALGVFHGSLKLGSYTATGLPVPAT